MLLLLWAGHPTPSRLSSPPCLQADARVTCVVPAAQLQRGAHSHRRPRCGRRLDGGGAAALRPAGALMLCLVASLRLIRHGLLPSTCMCAVHISKSRCCLFSEEVRSPFPAAAGPQANHTARILPRVIFELQGQVRHAASCLQGWQATLMHYASGNAWACGSLPSTSSTCMVTTQSSCVHLMHAPSVPLGLHPFIMVPPCSNLAGGVGGVPTAVHGGRHACQGGGTARL